MFTGAYSGLAVCLNLTFSDLLKCFLQCLLKMLSSKCLSRNKVNRCFIKSGDMSKFTNKPANIRAKWRRSDETTDPSKVVKINQSAMTKQMSKGLLSRRI